MLKRLSHDSRFPSYPLPRRRLLLRQLGGQLIEPLPRRRVDGPLGLFGVVDLRLGVAQRRLGGLQAVRLQVRLRQVQEFEEPVLHKLVAGVARHNGGAAGGSGVMAEPGRACCVSGGSRFGDEGADAAASA